MMTLGAFSVVRDPMDPDLILALKNEVNVAKKALRISMVRSHLLGTGLAQYTLNAVVRIAKYVSKELGLNYRQPTDLHGTTDDDKLIIPDEIAMGIVLLQAVRGVTVDGIAGADFIRKVMGLHRDIRLTAQVRAAFMDESNNKTTTNSAGKTIKLPDFTAGENVAYEFLRDITLARNGLWSDRPNIVNLTALRLEHGDTQIQWDDTIAACWISPEGQKNAKVYTATTEPGNRKTFKTLLPQTIIFVPGYHQGKLPAMRGHRTVTFVPTNKNPERLLFNAADERGLNLHPGGTTGAMKNLVKYILPVRAANEVEFKAVLVFMEIFRILSRWGLDPQHTAWENLKGWAAKKALRAGKASAGLVPVFQDEKVQPVKKISVLTARGWIARKWSANRANLLKVIRSVDPGFNPPANFNRLKTRDLENLITDAHIEGIIGRQCDYFFDAKEVDGLAGNTYMALLDAKIPADGSLARLANTDINRMNELFAQFGAANPVLTQARKKYVQNIFTQTLVERAKLHESEPVVVLESTELVAEPVGTWSILCQVVFGPESFYELMDFTLRNAIQTGQRRWYYTLVEEGSVT